MSTYSILNAPLPTISYCILHQTASPKMVPEYEANIRELHTLVRRESAELNSAYQKFVRDTVSHESQALRGSLAEFLATPVRSDNQSVHRIFTEGFERFQNQITGTGQLGATGSSEGRVVFPEMTKAPEQKIVGTGKAYLKELGLVPLKAQGGIYESVFIVEGGMNLDLLEYIIRDRLGIYATVHGQHLRLFGGVAFSGYNLIGTWGQQGEAREGFIECAFFFSKPNIQYGPFREILRQAMEGLEQKTQSITLWQRKLGFGRGREFIARCRCAAMGGLGDILSWLRNDDKSRDVRKIFIEQGCLIVKELIV